eukprot:624257-Pelagomonas_calceolata.AAC.3
MSRTKHLLSLKGAALLPWTPCRALGTEGKSWQEGCRVFPRPAQWSGLALSVAWNRQAEQCHCYTSPHARPRQPVPSQSRPVQLHAPLRGQQLIKQSSEGVAADLRTRMI